MQLAICLSIVDFVGRAELAKGLSRHELHRVLPEIQASQAGVADGLFVAGGCETSWTLNLCAVI